MRATKIHIITQYYQGGTADRQAEIDYCLERLLNSPWVERVHNLIEPQTVIPESLLTHPKHEVRSGYERLTYEAAFTFANTHLPGEVIGLCNADIYLDDTSDWQPVLELDPKLVLCQSRYEEEEDGSFYEADLIETSMGAMSQDAWFFRAPITVANCDFPLGVLGCDNAIAHRIKSSGYVPLNRASRHKIVHVDRCRGKTWDNFRAFHQQRPGNEPENNPTRQGQYYIPDFDRTPTIENFLDAFAFTGLDRYAIQCDLFSNAFLRKSRSKEEALSTLVPRNVDFGLNQEEDTVRHYVTYCDKNYLVRAVALARSLEAHESKAWKLYVVCCDELTRNLLTTLNLDGVVPIPLSDIERVFPQLDSCKHDRDLREYYWTLTPIVVRHILNTVPEASSCTYLDSDTLFFSDPQPVFDEFRGHSVLIHEHRFQRSMFDDYNPYIFGRFNVGLMSFRRDIRGLKVLDWWQERCLEWCYARIEEERFGDQKYLDKFPQLFEGVCILENIAAGTGPWNHENYRFDKHPQGCTTIDGEPLIHYHFHGLTICSRDVYVGFRFFYPIERNTLRSVYLPYLDALTQAWDLLDSIHPGFAQGTTSPLQVGAHNNTLLVRDHAHPRLDKHQDRLRVMPLSEGWSQGTSLDAIDERDPVAAVEAVVDLYRTDQSPENLRHVLQALLGVVKEEPGNVEAWVSLGELLLEAGQPSQAQKMLQAGLRHQPGHVRGNALMNQHFAP